MSLPANRSLITSVRVVFREVDRVHDMTPGQYRDAEGRLVHAAFPGDALSAGPAWVRLADDGADLEPAPGARPRPGLRRVVRVGDRQLLRGFDADASEPIAGPKCVYVWRVPARVDGPDVRYVGSAAELRHELVFADGRFREVDLAAQAGRDVRAATGPERDALLLDQVGLADGEQGGALYFALLSPYPLPWLALEGLREHATRRGTQLFDPLFMRVLPDGDGDPRPALPHDPSVSRPSFEVHLVDPFKEGLARNAEFEVALDAWQAEEQRLLEDPTYALARAVDDLAPAGFKHEHLDHSFGDLLRSRERTRDRLCWIAHQRASHCIEWIGREQRADDTRRIAVGQGWAESSVTFGLLDVPADAGAPTRAWPVPGAGRAMNAFSEAAQDFYLHGCTPEQYWDVAAIIGRCSHRLDETSAGKQWLRENFASCHQGAAVMADGGLGVVFRDVKKLSDGVKANPWVKGAIGIAAKWYGDAWVRTYQERAVSHVHELFKAKHGIEFPHTANRATRRALESSLRGELARGRRALAAGRDVPGLAPPAEHTLAGGAKKALVPLGLFSESLNVAVALHAFSESGKHTDLLAAGNSALKSWSALASLTGKELAFTTDLAYLERYSLKVSSVGLLTSAIDVGLEVGKWTGASNRRKAVGHALKTVGSLVGTAGGAATSTGVGVIAMFVGLLTSELGSYVIRISDDLRSFLKHSQWGRSGFVEGLVDDVLDEFGEQAFWFAGDLDTLADSVESQRACVRQFQLHFQPDIEYLPACTGKPLWLALRGHSVALTALLADVKPEIEIDFEVIPSGPSPSLDTPLPVERTKVSLRGRDLPLIDASDAKGGCLLLPLEGPVMDELARKLAERPDEGNWSQIDALAFHGTVRIHAPALGTSPAVIVERELRASTSA